LKHYPVFLILDDTLQPKFGMHFDEHQVLFDHARHNGSNYLKGHCFVSLVLSVPVVIQGTVQYLSVPLGYRLRAEKENKLELAADMIGRTVSDILALGLIANLQKDTKSFDLRLAAGVKRGRPTKKGQVSDIEQDIQWTTQVGPYWIGSRKVMTSLFS
jgi:hypothetical protein